MRPTRADKENAMRDDANGMTRRGFLRAAGLGTAGALAAGGMVSRIGPRLFVPEASAATGAKLALAATDGYMTLPGRDDPIYIFGFIPVSPTASVSSLIQTYKGHAQHTAPTLDLKQGDDHTITLTNLCLIQRPDLTDSHTIHWHGFDIP